MFDINVPGRSCLYWPSGGVYFALSTSRVSCSARNACSIHDVSLMGTYAVIHLSPYVMSQARRCHEVGLESFDEIVGNLDMACRSFGIIDVLLKPMT